MTDQPMSQPAPPQHSGTAPYLERLTPAWWIWLVTVGLGIGVGLAFARVSDTAGLVSFALATAAGLAGLVRSTPTVAVSDGSVRAGRAHVPVGLVSAVETLDAERMRQAVGPQIDARAYLCVRGWIPTGVRIQLNDPADPTPYWLVSSRRSEQLAAAVDRARATGPA